jgi:hypothetical protein
MHSQTTTQSHSSTITTVVEGSSGLSTITKVATDVGVAQGAIVLKACIVVALVFRPHCHRAGSLDVNRQRNNYEKPDLGSKDLPRPHAPNL